MRGFHRNYLQLFRYDRKRSRSRSRSRDRVRRRERRSRSRSRDGSWERERDELYERNKRRQVKFTLLFLIRRPSLYTYSMFISLTNNLNTGETFAKQNQQGASAGDRQEECGQDSQDWW